MIVNIEIDEERKRYECMINAEEFTTILRWYQQKTEGEDEDEDEEKRNKVAGHGSGSWWKRPD